MTIKFYSGNLVDQSNFSSSSENALFPLTNLKHPFRTKVFRSLTNSDEVIIDFMETSEVDTVILVDNWRDGFGYSTITLDLNATSNFTSPAFTQALSFDEKFRVGVNEFDLQEYRFARLSMDSALPYCELSKFFIGKKLILSDEKSNNYGWTYQLTDLSIIAKNRYGQNFTDKITKQKRITLSFSNLNKDQLEQIHSLTDAHSVTKPFFISIGCPSMNNELPRYQGMVYLVNEPSETNTTFGRYALSMTLLEAM